MQRQPKAVSATAWPKPLGALPSWAATARYSIRPAPPGGLALVQDFLNTRAHPDKWADLLGDCEQAQEWATTAIRSWSALRSTAYQALALTDDDVVNLRDLREVLDRLLNGQPAGLQLRVASRGEFALTEAGKMAWTPVGQGWRWLRSAILVEVALSQETGTWSRMKQCRKCRRTFYDISWNRSGMWHKPEVCQSEHQIDGVSIVPGTSLRNRC